MANTLGSIYFTIYMFVYLHTFAALGTRNDAISVVDRHQVAINNVAICRGPKRKDCCDYKIQIHEHTNLTFDLLVKEEMTYKGRIVGLLNGTEVARFQLTNPCSNVFIRAMTKTYMHSEDCRILKEHYKFNIDILDINRRYNPALYTPLFGDMTLKIVLYNDKCNFICFSVDLSPQDKSLA